MALMALVYLTAVQCAAHGVATLGTDEALWPAQPVQDLLALFLAAVLLNKRLKTETLSELNRISRHGDFLRIFRQFRYSRPSGSVAEPLG